MAQRQIPTDTFLLQAKDFLDRARRLKPGPARNELREVAKVLRELARLETQSEFAPLRAGAALIGQQRSTTPAAPKPL